MAEPGLILWNLCSLPPPSARQVYLQLQNQDREHQQASMVGRAISDQKEHRTLGKCSCNWQESTHRLRWEPGDWDSLWEAFLWPHRWCTLQLAQHLLSNPCLHLPYMHLPFISSVSYSMVRNPPANAGATGDVWSLSQEERGWRFWQSVVGCLGAGPLGSVVCGKCPAQLSWWDDQEGLEGRVTVKVWNSTVTERIQKEGQSEEETS